MISVSFVTERAYFEWGRYSFGNREACLRFTLRTLFAPLRPEYIAAWRAGVDYQRRLDPPYAALDDAMEGLVLGTGMRVSTIQVAPR